MQQTFVGRAEPGAVQAIAKRLEAHGMLARQAPHAIFSYTGNGLTVTLYNSGKLVVQGFGAQDFGEQLLGKTVAAKDVHEEEVIGTDESGKGDYFGPLVVAAVFVTETERIKMRAGEIDDSKKLSDTTIKRLAGAIMEKFPHAICVLDPPAYNRKYRELQNLNLILAQLHAQAILEVAGKVTCRKVLSDQFGDASLIKTALANCQYELDLRQRPRAEEDPAVAAASILARHEFVRRLKEISEEEAVDLPLGAGEEVERAAQRFIQLHGKQGLERVAKLHFKTTQKINKLF